MTDPKIIRLPRRVVDLPIKTLDDLAREHGVEAQVKPDLFEQLRQSSHGPARPSPSAGRPEARESATLFDRMADALGRAFGESPSGFAFFCGLLFPIAAAVFCVGYFGLRELLAVLS